MTHNFRMKKGPKEPAADAHAAAQWEAASRLQHRHPGPGTDLSERPRVRPTRWAECAGDAGNSDCRGIRQSPSDSPSDPSPEPLRADRMADMSETKTVRAVCPHDCPDTCGMLVTVKDGRAVSSGDPRSSLHRRLPVPEGDALSRTRLPCRSAEISDDSHRAQGATGNFAASAGKKPSSGITDEVHATSPNRRTARRRSCRTATPARWASCKARASIGASSIGSGRRCWIAPSAPRPGRPAATSRSARGRPSTRKRCGIRATSSTGAPTPASPTCTCGRSCTGPARPGPGSSPSIPFRCKTAERATGGCPSAPAPTPPSPLA